MGVMALRSSIRGLPPLGLGAQPVITVEFFPEVIWNQKVLFCRFLVHWKRPPLPFLRGSRNSVGFLDEAHSSQGGRTSATLNVEAIDMESYRVEKKAAMAIQLPDQEAEIEPVPGGGGGHKPEPEMDRLSNILKTFNDLCGNFAFSETDRVRIAHIVTEELTSDVLADPAYQNAKQHSDKQNARIEHDKAVERAAIGRMKTDIHHRQDVPGKPPRGRRAALCPAARTGKAPPSQWVSKVKAETVMRGPCTAGMPLAAASRRALSSTCAWYCQARAARVAPVGPVVVRPVAPRAVCTCSLAAAAGVAVPVTSRP